MRNGLSKSVPKPEEVQQQAEKRRRTKAVPLIGDNKKDKLKNSLGMSNEEKSSLVARERDMSRNRGMCMVSGQLRNAPFLLIICS